MRKSQPSYLRYVFGTQVSNPMRRQGESAYLRCPACARWFTRMGLTKHQRSAHPKRRNGNATSK